MYLLDTDILIYALKGHETVVHNLRLFKDTPKAISVISYGELVFGAQRSQRVPENLAKVYRLKEIFPVIDVSPAVMETFGLLKADLKREGVSVDDFDLIVGCTGLTMGYSLVTNNEKHFKKIPGLTVANWTKNG